MASPELKTFELWISRSMNMKFNLIFSLYPGKYLKCYQLDQTSGNLKIFPPYNNRNLIGQNPVKLSGKREKCPQWIFRLSNHYLGYLIIKFST